MFRFSLICLLLMLFGTWSIAQTNDEFRTYSNARFDYTIGYPPNLIPQGEAENGDGQKFLARDGRVELIVYGSNNALDRTLKAVYEEEAAPRSNRTISYQALRRDWFVVSGIEHDKVFYQKTILNHGVFKTFRIEYDKSLKETWDPITARIARSFKG